MPEVILDHRPHPLTEDGRDRRKVTIEAGATVEEIVAGETRRRAVDMEVLLDGRELETLDVEPGPGSVIAVRPRLRGGLGRILGTILLVAAAIFVPPALGLTGIWATLAGAAITVIGGLVLNALFPIDEPDVGQIENPTAAQLFSLSGGSNRARRYDAFPLVLGQHRMFPDLAALEYTENDGDDQFFHGIYHFGLGDLDVSELRNGTTPLGDYDGVTTELSGADGAIDLVAGNVDTIAGAALTDTDWISRRTGDGTMRIGVDFGGRIFKVTDRGEHVEHSVAVQVRVTKGGNTATHDYTLTHDDSGVYRRSVNITLPSAGVWTVEVRRTTAPDESERIYDEVQFAALRSYQPDEGDYTGQTRLGVRIKASGQLNGRLDRLSALVKQRVPVPTAGVWGAANVETSNPAALFRWFAKGVTVAGRTVAGVGLADARIDHDGLARWFAWCDAKGYRCDLVIQSGMTMDAVLRLIARRGRATLSWKTGKLGVVYEDEAATPETLISPANIVAGTFGVVWNSEPPSDEVVVRYIEPDMDWGWNSVRRNRPGLVGTPQSTSTVTARGVTVRDNAAIECNLQAARQHYHRRRLGWEMGREGRDLHVGDVAWITHSLIDQGIAGRLAAASGAVATLDRAPAGVTGGHVMFRLPDGELHTSAISSVDGRELTLADPPAWPGQPQDTTYRLYDDADPPRKARIIEVAPRSATRFRFSAIDEVGVYHTLATSDLTVPFPDVHDRRPRVVSVQFAARRIQVGTGEMVELQASLAVAGAWTGAVVRAGATAGELRTVDRLDGPADLIAKWIIPPGVGQHVEIVPGKDLTPDGPVWTGMWGTDPDETPPPVTEFAVTQKAGNIREIVFQLPVWPTVEGALIRMENDPDSDIVWESMVPLHQGVLSASPYLAMSPGGGEWRFEARAVTTSGVESEGVSIDVSLDNLPATFAGITWHTVSGEPPASLGMDGDRAVRVDEAGAGKIYSKADGAWTLLGDLGRADSAFWHIGTDVPPASLGKDGDFYFREGTAQTAGEIYEKSSGSWVLLFDVGDGEWLAGSGNPTNSLGKVGQFYFDTASGNVWKKTAVNTWTFQRDITGPEGLDGVGIVSISRSGSTVTVTYTDGTTDTFTVNDGADGVTLTSIRSNADGSVTVTYSDSSSFTIPAGQAGRGIRSIVRNATTGVVTVTFDDSTTSTFVVSDGMDGEDGAVGPVAWTEIYSASAGTAPTWPSTSGARAIWVVFNGYVYSRGGTQLTQMAAAIAGNSGTVYAQGTEDLGKDGETVRAAAWTISATGMSAAGDRRGTSVRKVFRIDAET